ncbi:MAG: sugar ABC transporter substrate-binding protein, partial [Angelakisella sp.]
DIAKFAHLQQMKNDFEAANGDIKIEFVTVPNKYADTMETKLSAGEIPDVMMLGMDHLPRYVDKGMLLPLEDLASQEYQKVLFPVVKNALTLNDKLYAAPREVTPRVMFLNTEMFEDAKLELPTEDWTMDEFTKLARKLTNGSGANAQWGYYWKNGAEQTFAIIAAMGGELYAADGKSSVFSTDENTEDAMEYLYNLCNKYKVCPTASQAGQFGDNEFALFLENKVAMQLGTLATASKLKKNDVNFTVLPMPSVDGASRTAAQVTAWVIPARAKHPELSWRVVEFLSGKPGQQIVLDSNFGLPATVDTDTTLFEAAAPYNKYFVAALKTAVPYPTHKNGAAFLTAFQENCEKLWGGKVRPDDFAEEIDELSKEILSQ